MKYEEEEEEEVNLIESRGAALIRWGFAIIQPFTNHSQLGRLQSRRHRCHHRHHHVYHPHTTRWHCHADLHPPAHYLRQGATVSIWPVHRGPPGSDKLITGTRRATGAHCCTLGWTLKCALWWTPVDTLVCTGTHRCTFAQCTLPGAYLLAEYWFSRRWSVCTLFMDIFFTHLGGIGRWWYRCL